MTTMEQVLDGASAESLSAPRMHTAEIACEDLRISVLEARAALADHSDWIGDCLVWTKDRDSRGYGQLIIRDRSGRRRFSAHRLSYLLNNGPIPVGLCVMHICDNRPCINPNHLVAGSHAANMQDVKRKGRSMSGAASPRAKLTEEEAKMIRELGRVGNHHHHIAARFGVSRSTVTKIINGTAYREPMND